MHKAVVSCKAAASWFAAAAVACFPSQSAPTNVGELRGRVAAASVQYLSKYSTQRTEMREQNPRTDLMYNYLTNLTTYSRLGRAKMSMSILGVKNI